jgi:hypothetical protein
MLALQIYEPSEDPGEPKPSTATASGHKKDLFNSSMEIELLHRPWEWKFESYNFGRRNKEKKH